MPRPGEQLRDLLDALSSADADRRQAAELTLCRLRSLPGFLHALVFFACRGALASDLCCPLNSIPSPTFLYEDDPEAVPQQQQQQQRRRQRTDDDQPDEDEEFTAVLPVGECFFSGGASAQSSAESRGESITTATSSTASATGTAAAAAASNEEHSRRTMAAVLAKGVVSHHWFCLPRPEVDEVEGLLLQHLIDLPTPAIRSTIYLLIKKIAARDISNWGALLPTIRHLITRCRAERRHKEVSELLDLIILLPGERNGVLALEILNTNFQVGLLNFAQGMKQFSFELCREETTVHAECRRKCLLSYNEALRSVLSIRRGGGGAGALESWKNNLILPNLSAWLSVVKAFFTESLDNPSDLEGHRLVVAALRCIKTLVVFSRRLRYAQRAAVQDPAGPRKMISSGDEDESQVDDEGRSGRQYFYGAEDDDDDEDEEDEKDCGGAADEEDEDDEEDCAMEQPSDELLPGLRTTLDEIFDISLRSLDKYKPVFESMVVTEAATFEEEETGGPLTLVNYLCNFILFCSRRTELRRTLLAGKIGRLLSVLVYYARITDAQEVTWATDLKEFLLQECHTEPSLDYSGPRRPLRDLIQALLFTAPDETVEVLLGLIERMTTEGDYKAKECAMWLAGVVARHPKFVVDTLADRHEMVCLMRVVGMSVSNSLPVLRARALLCAADLQGVIAQRFRADVPRLVRLAADLLQQDSVPLVQTAAAAALACFLQQISCMARQGTFHEPQQLSRICSALLNAASSAENALDLGETCGCCHARTQQQNRSNNGLGTLLLPSQSKVADTCEGEISSGKVLSGEVTIAKCCTFPTPLPRSYGSGAHISDNQAFVVETVVTALQQFVVYFPTVVFERVGRICDWTVAAWIRHAGVPRLSGILNDFIAFCCRSALRDEIEARLLPVLLRSLEIAVKQPGAIESYTISSTLQMLALIFRAGEPPKARVAVRLVMLLLLEATEPPVVAAGVQALHAALKSFNRSKELVEDVAQLVERVLSLELPADDAEPVAKLLVLLVEELLEDSSAPPSASMKRLLVSAVQRKEKGEEEYPVILLAVSRVVVTRSTLVLGILKESRVLGLLLEAWCRWLEPKHVFSRPEKRAQRYVVVEAATAVLTQQTELSLEPAEAARLLHCLLGQFAQFAHKLQVRSSAEQRNFLRLVAWHLRPLLDERFAETSSNALAISGAAKVLEIARNQQPGNY